MYLLEGEKMRRYKPLKIINGAISVLLLTILFDGLVVITSMFANDYVLNLFLKIFLLIFNIYQGYYIIKFLTLSYEISEEGIKITSMFGFRQLKVEVNEATKYKQSSGEISAVKLSGYGSKKFALGTYSVKNVGYTYMNITWDDNIFYIKDKERVYGISPLEIEAFQAELEKLGAQKGEVKIEDEKTNKLYKDNYFRIPFIIVSVLIMLLIFRPIALYYMHKLPDAMPLSFNVKFKPTINGTSRDFVVKQIEYGVLNMAFCFCMYFLANINAKYHKKSSYKYIYYALGVVIVFLLLQQKILHKFA